jgi:hypothetical protein
MTVDRLTAVAAGPSGSVLERAPDDRMRVMLPVTGDLIIWVGHRRDTSLLYLEGDLDAAGTEYLRATIDEVRRAAEHITIDSTGLRFIDVRGYRALIGCLPSPNGSGEATLVVGSAIGRLQHLLALAGCGFDCEECNFSL